MTRLRNSSNFTTNTLRTTFEISLGAVSVGSLSLLFGGFEMCRIGAVKSKKPVYPSTALRLMLPQQEGLAVYGKDGGSAFSRADATIQLLYRVQRN